MKCQLILSITLDLDESIYTEWGDNFSEIVKDAVEYEVQQTVKKALSDKKIRERLAELIKREMDDKLKALGV